MFLVGLTGGIASGKSTVSCMFKDLGCPLVDADVVAREVVEPGKPAWRQIKERFGVEFILPDGSIDREKLGQVIFSDPKKRRLLNSITHPQIYRAMLRKIFSYLIRGEPFVILDLPLLFESGAMVKYMKYIIVINCNSETQLMRLQNRNNYTEEEALQRINAQFPLDEKCEKANFVIENSGSIKDTQNQVHNIFNSLRRSKAHWKLRILLFSLTGGVIFVLHYLCTKVIVL